MWPFKQNFLKDAAGRAPLLLRHGELVAIASLESLESFAPEFDAIAAPDLQRAWMSLFSVSVATVALMELRTTVAPSQHEAVFDAVKIEIDRANPKAFTQAVLPLLANLREVRQGDYANVIGGYVLCALAQLAPREARLDRLASDPACYRAVGHLILSAGHHFFRP